MNTSGLLLRCTACGREIDLLRELPFGCPEAQAGDDRDHLLSIVQKASPGDWPVSLDPNPFQRFAVFSVARSLADCIGLSRQDYLEQVKELNQAVEAVAGTGFVTTPYLRDETQGVWIKDETQGVAGSHKARHLMGIALYLTLAVRVPTLAAQLADAPLAVASCGNAALAAASLAAAIGRDIDVYIPSWADPSIVERLERLGARLHTCERGADAAPGDPCYHAFVKALERGAIPFTCQGNRNGLAMDGGRSLAWELAEQHMSSGSPHLERLLVQVGGGALASSTLQGLWLARDAQVIPELPVLHAVQVECAQPLVGAWRRLAAELAGRQAPDHELARIIHLQRSSEEIHEAMGTAMQKRSRYMVPISEPPCSVADGILDDETYDGFATMLGMFLTGGWPVVVDEELLVRARDEGAASSGVKVSATGSAGLAGLLALRSAGLVPEEEQVAVLFTGVAR